MDVKRREKEHISRQQAAERLTDMAYALAGAGLLELTVDGRRIAVPVAEELLLERELKSKGDRVELELELTWSTPSASPSGTPQGLPGE